MGVEEATPSVSRGLFRVGTFLAFVAFVSYFLWDMYSESAALRRLADTAKNFPYTERCDADGNWIATGPPNCVDLNGYLFVYGPVSRAFRRACSGKAATTLLFEKNKVARTEIISVQRSLQFKARTGVNPPC